MDTEYVKNRKVFVHVLAAFRYGREDLDVLGLTFRKDLYLASMQVSRKTKLIDVSFYFFFYFTENFQKSLFSLEH